MEFINLTPHAISIQVGGVAHRFEPTGDLARVATAEDDGGFLDLGGGSLIPVLTRKAGAVTGLPAPEPGKYILVSGMVLDALAGSGRLDVFAPDTGAGGGPKRTRSHRGGSPPGRGRQLRPHPPRKRRQIQARPRFGFAFGMAQRRDLK